MLRRLLAGSRARRGFLALLLGTGFGNALTLILSPVITRLFDPSSFGSFTVLAAIAMVLAPLMSLRLELAVPLPEREASSYAIVHAGIVISMVLGSALSVVFYLVGPTIGEALNQRVVGTWLWVTPVMASAMACFSVLNALAIRGGRFTAIARRNVVMTCTTLGLQIVAGILGYGVWGLVVGFALGQVVGAFSLFLGAGLGGADAAAGRQFRLVRETLRRYRHVPALLAVAGTISILGLQAPVLIIAHYFSSEVVGWFGLTQRVLAAPVTLIGLSVAQVYLSEVARTRREVSGRERHYFWKASKALFAVGTVFALILLAFGPLAFGSIFGEQWRTSGLFAQALAIALAAQLIASPLSQTLIVFERNRLQLAWDTGRLLAVGGTVIATGEAGGSATAVVWALCLALTTMYALSWDLSRRTLRAEHRHHDRQ
ncbi:lipopolysaccharide biosynthesis protein [Cumulibacter manganitolerans]|uniref:lipopolysaccharide biosynthesis protein n=1 Tax=Cumulibacter manganitolerans TaxID=1884992 RepID=UPI001297AA9F|nr:oligosaccharide flippase family protein [Cumulibacter manganitolerans]